MCRINALLPNSSFSPSCRALILLSSKERIVLYPIARAHCPWRSIDAHGLPFLPPPFSHLLAASTPPPAPNRCSRACRLRLPTQIHMYVSHEQPIGSPSIFMYTPSLDHHRAHVHTHDRTHYALGLLLKRRGIGKALRPCRLLLLLIESGKSRVVRKERDTCHPILSHPNSSLLL